MADPAAPAALSITVMHAGTHGVWQVALVLAPGATVRDAVEASGFLPLHPWFCLEDGGIGVFGKVRPLSHALADHDRVEVYRELMFDPKDSRRRRAAHKARAAARRT